MWKLISPVEVKISNKRKMILNLNQFRNLYYRYLNLAKIEYKSLMEEQLSTLPKFKKAGIIYVVYKGDKRRFDIGNIVSVHQKFFEDAFVETGHLEDDKAQLLPFYCGTLGRVSDPEPRVEINIFDISTEEGLNEMREFTNNIIDSCNNK